MIHIPTEIAFEGEATIRLFECGGSGVRRDTVCGRTVGKYTVRAKAERVP